MVGEPRHQGLLSRGHRATTIGFVLIVSLIAFETLAVGTAMPTIVADLNGLRLYGWAFTCLLMANVIGVAFGGEICDSIGARTGLLLGVIMLTAGLLTAGLAPGMGVFLTGRSLQGFGGGLVIVSLYVLAATAYDEQLRPKLFAAEAAAWVLPALVGPFFAGLAVDLLTWRLLFLTIAPLALTCLALIWPASHTAPRSPVTLPAILRLRRWLIAIPAATALALIQYAGQQLGWTGALFGVVGITTLVLTLRRLLPHGVFSLRRGVPVIVVSRGLANGAYNGIVAFVPLMLMSVHGFSPTAAGLPLTLGTLGWAIASALQARLRHVPATTWVRGGFTSLAIAGLLLAVVAGGWLSGWWTYPIWVLGGAGVGAVFPTLAVLLLKHSPVESRGNNSAGFSMAETMAAALTVGIGGALIAAAEDHRIALATGLATTLTLMGLVALIGALIANRTSPHPGAGTR